MLLRSFIALLHATSSSLGHRQFHCQFLHSSVSIGPISSHYLVPNNRSYASSFDPTTDIRIRADWRSDKLRGSFNSLPALFLLRAPLPSLLSLFANSFMGSSFFAATIALTFILQILRMGVGVTLLLVPPPLLPLFSRQRILLFWRHPVKKSNCCLLRC